MNNAENSVHLRGHHLRLLYGFIFSGRENEIREAAEIEHGETQAENTINVLRKIAETKTNVVIVDSLDDICETCDKKNSKTCSEFVPYGVSAASDDRATIHNLGLRKNVPYGSKLLIERLKKAADLIFE